MSLTQTWGDSPSTGAYQTQDILPVFRQAVENSVWMPLCKRVEINGGQSVTIPIRSRVTEPTTTALNENLSIPLSKLTISSNIISMTERGRAVMMSRKAINRSPIDLLAEHRDALSEEMGLDMDGVLGAAAQSGPLKYAANGAASYALGTAGSFTAAATSNPNFFHLRKMRDLAVGTYFMPKPADGSYKFVVQTNGLRGILDDPEFLEINSPQNRQVFGENLAGRIAGIDIIEENHALAGNVGTNSDVGEGVFMARDGIYYAVLEMPSIHYDATHDHGRFASLAWYGDWGAGLPSSSASAGYPRLIHFGSQ